MIKIMNAAPSQLMNLLDNFLRELMEILVKESEFDLYKSKRDLMVSSITFESKVSELRDMVKMANITEDQKSVMNQKIDDIVTEGSNLLDGIGEMKRMVSKANFPKSISQKFYTILDNSADILTAPYQIKVPDKSYDRVMKLIRQNNMQDMVMAVQGTSGSYYFFFDALYKKAMEQICLAAALDLGKVRHPTEHDVKISAWTRTEGNQNPNVLVYEGLSPELAEKCVQKADQYGILTFAKVLQNDGTYNLVCDAGNTQKEKDKIYSEAAKVILDASFSLTGIGGKYEKDKMRHLSKEYENLEAIIDSVSNSIDGEKNDSGYVFSIVRDAKDNIITNNYIHFVCEKNQETGLFDKKFISHHDGIIDSPINEMQCDDYKRVLSNNIRSGAGQKVYISDERMQELKDLGKTLYHRLETRSNGHITSATIMEEQKNTMSRIENLRSQLRTADKTGKTMIWSNINQENIYMNGLTRYGSKIGEDDFIRAAVSNDLEHHVFKTMIPQNEKDQIMAERRLIQWIINERTKDGSLDLNNRLIPGKVLSRGLSMDSLSEVIKSIGQKDIDAFLQREFQIAKPAPEDGQKPDYFTIDDYKKESAILENGMSEHIQEVSDLVNIIKMNMQEVQLGPEVMGISMIATKSAEHKRDQVEKDIKNEIDEINGSFIEDNHEETNEFVQIMQDEEHERSGRSEELSK